MERRMSDSGKPIGMIAVIVALISFVIGGEITFWISFCLCAMLLIARNVSVSGQRKGVYLVLLFVHLCLLIYHSIYQNLPMSGGDWGVYVRVANNMVANCKNVIEIINPFNARFAGDLYERFCALIYYCFGYSQKYMYFVSFLAGEIVYYYLNRVAFTIDSSNPDFCELASLIFYITPIEMVFSVDFLREMCGQAVFIVSVYWLFRFIYFGNKLEYIKAVILALLLSLIHSGYVGTFLAYIAIYLLIDKNKKRLRLTPFRIGFLFAIIALISFSPIWSFVAARFTDVGSISDLAARTSTIYSRMGNTNYIGSPETSMGVVLQTPLRVFYYLVSPLPWQVISINTAIAMVADSVIRWIVFYRIVKMALSREIRNRMAGMDKVLFGASILIICSTTLIFAWGTSNYGTAMRHRTGMYPLEIVLFFDMWKKYATGTFVNERHGYVR